MSLIQTDSQHYSDIADAIRSKNGTQNVYYPADMASAIADIGRIIYSLTEQVVGQWIDGKPLYQKTFSCGPLPSGSSNNEVNKDVDHNISNLGYVVNISGFAKRASGFNRISLPFVGIETDTSDTQVRIMVSDTQIRISSKFNRSEFTDAYITLQYTKTTD